VIGDGEAPAGDYTLALDTVEAETYEQLGLALLECDALRDKAELLKDKLKQSQSEVNRLKQLVPSEMPVQTQLQMIRRAIGSNMRDLLYEEAQEIIRMAMEYESSKWEDHVYSAYQEWVDANDPQDEDFDDE